MKELGVFSIVEPPSVDEGDTRMKEFPTLKLYKYKPLSDPDLGHVKEMLEKNVIWFSSPESLNDPFDCRFYVDSDINRMELISRLTAYKSKQHGETIESCLRQANREIPMNRADMDRDLKRKFDRIARAMSNTGILSLTPVPDNLLMWTHYAKSHTGICIEFSLPENPTRDQVTFFAGARRVDYANTMPIVNIVYDKTEVQVSKIIFTKSMAYEYESEHRIVRFNEGPGLKSIPVGIIQSIILGAKISDENRQSIIDACKNYNGDISVMQAKLHPDPYAILIEKATMEY